MRALAPDADSASAGRELASARKWTSLGMSERAAWGVCLGLCLELWKTPCLARIDVRGGQPSADQRRHERSQLARLLDHVMRANLPGGIDTLLSRV